MDVWEALKENININMPNLQKAPNIYIASEFFNSYFVVLDSVKS